MRPELPLTFEDSAEDLILNSLPDSVIAVNKDNVIIYVNNATEHMFSSGAKMLINKRLEDVLSQDSPVIEIVNQSRHTKTIISEYDITFDNPKYGRKFVDIHVSPIIEKEGGLVLQVRERSIAQKINQQMNHQGAARSVAGMASVLAHEIKNPLSGIRGSAQLLEQDIPEDDRDLTQLICEETDRICALVDQMEVFSNSKPVAPNQINLHEILEHVRKLAENGFGQHITFREYYDPSIPAAHGDKGQLTQVFLNLIKNAVEAAPSNGGEVTLTTAYQHGVRMVVPGSNEKMHLPLEICVIDNGVGISEDIKQHLFDPFVTTKANGTGLGLALVAKIIADHGGIIECDSTQDNTVFRVLLPDYKGQKT